MNLLGHLFFSPDNPEIKVANLAGDFIKGRDLGNFPLLVQSGLMLHRHIDDYFDHHPAVVKLLHLLYGKLPKVAGIATDLYFDHLLAINWKDYSKQELSQFLSDFYQFKTAFQDVYPEHFLIFLHRLQQHQWISQYHLPEGLQHMAKGVASRLHFKNQLEFAADYFDEFEQEITKAFRAYMQDAIPHFQSWILQNTQF